MTHKTLPKPTRDNRQVKEYVDAVRSGANGRFVVPNGKGWYARKADDKPGKLFSTKDEAISHATKDARRAGAELFIFDKNGRLTHRKKA